ncbi:MAG: hypothetical protein KKE27_19790 [Alphaproteobacteria bacterium]|uniref:hypothetical protein n=1 Tax=Pseudomonas aeruginosa TaxID=287 RepID=UPI00374A48B2|nr:hypothetical protein [Alphaproteobacteria bacterium]
MKKTILTIAILTASAFANAEYMIKIPLEANNGGALPNGSIQIVKNEPAPAPAPMVLTDEQIIETINSFGDASITFASRSGSVVVNYPIAKDFGCTFSFEQREAFERHFHNTNMTRYGKSVLVEYLFYGACV